jgi:hypothetical protein
MSRGPRFAALALIAAGAVPVALASASAPRAHVATAACSAANTQVWLGDGEGGGTAGRVYYPLEFSNVGHSACTLYGYPGVSAWRSGGAQVGGAAGRNSGPHSTVTIPAGGTAHALLSIADWGAICSKAVNASGLKVYPPGQTKAKTIGFPLQVCATTSVLAVEPIRSGVGIPGYTNS